MNYGKIENGAVTLLDKNDPQAYPLVCIPTPSEEAPEGYYWESGWVQKEDRIEMIWFLEKYEPTAEDIVDILTGESND